MGVYTTGSGTQTVVLQTEHAVFQTTTTGTYCFGVDLGNLSGGDMVELRIRGRLLSAGTDRIMYYALYMNTNTAAIQYSPQVMIPVSLTCSIKQIAGTARSFDWAVMETNWTMPNNFNRKINVTTTGETGLDWSDIVNATTTTNLTGTTINTTTAVGTIPFSSAGVGVDWSHVGNPTTSQNLSSTTINSATNVAVANNVVSVTNAVAVDWAQVQNKTSTVNLSNTTVFSLTSVVASVSSAVIVGTNNDKTGYAIGVGGIDSTSFVAGAINSATVAQSAGQEIADEVLNRNLAMNGSGNTRNVVNALRALRNRVTEAAGTLTVNQEDDATPAWTASVTRTAGKDPITDVDPTGP